MSKRKNPLEHLDEFLKQEASSFVEPKKFGEPKKEKSATPKESVTQEQQPEPVRPEEISVDHIAELIRKLADKNNLSMRDQLLDLTQYIMENHTGGNAKDKMLINTILYLKYPENWKEKIESYWETNS